jgi:hypothetical protein
VDIDEITVAEDQLSICLRVAAEFGQLNREIEHLTSIVEAARLIPCEAGSIISKKMAKRLQAAFDSYEEQNT